MNDSIEDACLAGLMPDLFRVARHEQQSMGLSEEALRFAASGQFQACQVVVHAAEAFDVLHAVPQRPDFGVPVLEFVLVKQPAGERDQAIADVFRLIQQRRGDIAGQPVGRFAERGLC